MPLKLSFSKRYFFAKRFYFQRFYMLHSYNAAYFLHHPNMMMKFQSAIKNCFYSSNGICGTAQCPPSNQFERGIVLPFPFCIVGWCNIDVAARCMEAFSIGKLGRFTIKAIWFCVLENNLDYCGMGVRSSSPTSSDSLSLYLSNAFECVHLISQSHTFTEITNHSLSLESMELFI